MIAAAKRPLNSSDIGTNEIEQAIYVKWASSPCHAHMRDYLLSWNLTFLLKMSRLALQHTNKSITNILITP